MPGLPQAPQLPPEPSGTTPADRWGVSFQRAFRHLWTAAIYVVNAICKADTLANRPSTPDLDEIFFVASDTDQVFVGVSGAWKEVGRIGGTSGGGMSFTEISDLAAPAVNVGRLYARDNGAGKTQLVVRFNSGAIQVISTEP